MKKTILFLILILSTSPLYGADESSCIDKDTVREANYHLTVDPLTTISILSSVPDCDDKFALMHKATVEITKRCRYDLFYSKIPPNDLDNKILNRYEKYIIENPDQFNPSREVSPLTASNYWIRQIKNPEHPILADYKWDNIKLFYDGAWEDGDGDMQSYLLVKQLTDWLNAYPNHANVPKARELISFMKSRPAYHIQESLVGTWTGELITTKQNGDVKWRNNIQLVISEDDYRKGIFTDITRNQSWETSVFAAGEKIKMTFGYEKRWFTFKNDGDVLLLSIEYKLKMQGELLDNVLVLRKQ